MDKVIFNMECQLVDKWNQFVSDDICSLTTESLVASFSCKADVVHYKSGVKFANIVATPRVISSRSDKVRDAFYVVFSDGPITWVNGNNKGCLDKGVVVFNCQQKIYYRVPQACNITVLLLPFDTFATDSDIKYIKLKTQLSSNNCIYKMLQEMTTNEHELHQKIIAVSSLLALNESTNDGRSRLDISFDLAFDYIKNNAQDSSLSIGKLARALKARERTIQRVLLSKGVTYSYLVKITRVGFLMSSLRSCAHRNDISQMCYESGFNSYSNACYQFKSVYGVSIAEFRSQMELDCAG